MTRQLLNSVIAKYCNLPVSGRSIIFLSLWLWQIIKLFVTGKSLINKLFCSTLSKMLIICACFQGGVDGIIVTNTTVARPETLKSEHKKETGGLSGKPLTEMSTRTVSDMYKLTGGK